LNEFNYDVVGGSQLSVALLVNALIGSQPLQHFSFALNPTVMLNLRIGHSSRSRIRFNQHLNKRLIVERRSWPTGRRQVSWVSGHWLCSVVVYV